jgi:neutral ceramidase
MSLYAGFAEVEITPLLGTHKIGWLKVLTGTEIRDPLFARAAIFRTPQGQVAFLQLDTLFIAWPEVAAIRQEIAARFGFPPEHVMVAATHNHAGPAVAHAGDVAQDVPYTQTLVSRTVTAFGQALENLQEAEVGVGSCFEWRVAHNRRVVMRDGTVRTHGTLADPNALCLEGPIDPEVSVLVARDKGGRLLGTIVNFACHPTHHGGDEVISAGFPGELAAEMRAGLGEEGGSRGPPTLFLNGASGNVHTADPARNGAGLSQEEVGQILAGDARQVIQGMRFRDSMAVGAASCTVELPYRRVTPEEIAGRARGAQRFIDPAIYDRAIPELVEKIRQRGTHRAEIQVLFMDEYAFAGVPAEYFVELGLQIKQRAYPVHALVVTCANGRAGYVPTRDAFRRGGYETTFGPSSMLAPEAGELIAETAVALIRQNAPPL